MDLVDRLYARLPEFKASTELSTIIELTEGNLKVVVISDAYGDPQFQMQFTDGSCVDFDVAKAAYSEALRGAGLREIVVDPAPRQYHARLKRGSGHAGFVTSMAFGIYNFDTPEALRAAKALFNFYNANKSA